MAKSDIRDIFKFNLLGRTLIDPESKYDFPKVDYSNNTPFNIISFNQALTTQQPEAHWLHFYIDDYQFERIWNSPEKYLPIIKRFAGIIAPDFSVYTDMPKAQQIYQIYKMRLLSAYFASHGIKVIPNITWANVESLDISLEGIPKGNVIALSTNGCVGKHRKEFIKVFNIVLDRLNPEQIIIVGRNIKEIDSNKITWINSYFQELEEYALIEKERR